MKSIKEIDAEAEALEAYRTNALNVLRTAVARRISGRIEMNVRNFNLHPDPIEREKARIRIDAYQNALNDLNGIFLVETTNADR